MGSGKKKNSLTVLKKFVPPQLFHAVSKSPVQ